ncbi:DUF4296 domain-containing protein [Dysgonomonas sp. PH5-37]|uniref:DUF4296 domain-containing protein n=2 Tax=unclassified Dysgonomonas TaxID=2630389 RepID=UPI0024732979|nr:DUF4296 domain-containing protein [Dysgonomonas sp. PH5-37]
MDSKKRSLYVVLLVVCCMLFATSCRKEAKILSQEEMVSVLSDIQIARVIYLSDPDYRSPEARKALMDGVLAKHKITQVDLDSSLMWYSDHVDVYLKVNDSVVVKLNRIKAEVAPSTPVFAKLRTPDDILPEKYYITKYTPTLSFTADSAHSVQYSDFDLKFKVQGIGENTAVRFQARIEYPDTVVIQEQKITENKEYKILIPRLKDKKVCQISGYIHANASHLSGDKRIYLYDIKLKKNDLQGINHDNKE